ncbi:MAG TPA: transposase, partial [Urbifossiella sp.]|nr:transposase [Urbifossiella sp.]
DRPHHPQRVPAPRGGIRWAVDSTGFSGCRFIRWFDEKYGSPRKEVAWTKAHVICGTRTNAIAAAEILDSGAADSPQLPGLVKTAAKSFTVREVAADKAYPSVENFDVVNEVGGTLYAAFKSSATGAAGGIYGKMYHYFALNKEEYMDHYHRRSMVESTFSMITGSSLDNAASYIANETPGNLVCCINPSNRSGRYFTVINSSTT